jgi:drug/metabolite transporter (DMT)-like permease
MKNMKYVLMVLLGGSMYGTMSSIVKLSYSRGYTAAEVSFSQAFLAALFLGVYLFITSKKYKTKNQFRKEIVGLLFIGSMIGLTNFLYYQSVSFISASMAIVILMQFTWFGLLLEWFFFRKKPAIRELLTVLFILVGTVLAADLVNASMLTFSWAGFGLALCSSLTYAGYIVGNSRAGKEVTWQWKSTIIMVGSALTILMINIKPIISDNHFGFEFLGFAIFIAILGTTIPTALFAIGIPKIGAGVSAILMTIELPVAMLCANIILDERINLLQTVGLLIMVTAISMMNYQKSRRIERD